MITLTADDLKKRQSVRATFKLPEESISLLRLVARQLGVKQKSLFDQLTNNPLTLRQMIQDSLNFVENQKNRQQKTFVISRSALLSITTTAKQENISRDRLVEISISRLMPILADEQKRHEKRKEIVSEMKEHLRQGEKIMNKVDALLGNDNQVFEMLQKQQQLARKNISKVDKLIEHGTAMETL